MNECQLRRFGDNRHRRERATDQEGVAVSNPWQESPHYERCDTAPNTRPCVPVGQLKVSRGLGERLKTSDPKLTRRSDTRGQPTLLGEPLRRKGEEKGHAHALTEAQDEALENEECGQVM